tara:strand:- start:559 stop:1512 length:954 start_codon:yes stop_codon:yes gene_type:complete
VITKKILILEGGYNEEHKVSLKTSLEIQKILKKINIKFVTLKVNPVNFEKQIYRYRNFICLNALHGTFGEDGQIQKILKEKKIKYTHSGVRSSKICFDKFLSKQIISQYNIFTPKCKVINKYELNYELLLRFKKKYNRFVIKPINSGSSFGIEIVKNLNDLNNLLLKLNKFKKKLKNHKLVMIEEFIEGKELTVSTIKLTNQINALAVTEIKTKNKFFDYQSKYSKGYSKHILPANVNNKIYNKCLKISIKCHKLLGCKSIARTDFIYNSNNNRIYFLETNTQPGLTSVSLLPEQARYRNISFTTIIKCILKNLNGR